MFLNGNLKIEDLPNAKEYLTYVYKHNIPLDAKNINSLPDIFNKIEKYKVYDTKELGDILGVLNDKEYDIKLNGEGWLIVVPLTERASCYLGVNAEWCTTWGKHSMNPSNKGRTNRFNSYSEQGPLYIIINKKNQNEKYQFHFPNKEFMNYRNSSFDHNGLLNNNPEIKGFFFPSLFGSVSNFEKEIAFIDLLDNENTKDFLKANIDSSGKNALVNALINGDYRSVGKLIVDEEYLSSGEDDIDIVDRRLEIKTYSVDGIVEQVKDLINAYENASNNSMDHVRDQLDHDRHEGEVGWVRESVGLFAKYYSENKDDIVSEMGINDFDTFKKLFWEEFLDNEHLYKSWRDKVVDKTSTIYDTAYEAKKNGLTKIISFDPYFRGRGETIKLSIPYFCMFLIKNNINSINGNLGEIIESYVEYHFGVYVEFDDVYVNYNYPDYEEMYNDLNDFFESHVPDDYNPTECLRYMEVLDDIKTKYFDDNEFENEEIIFKLKSNKIDCTNGMIMVFYMNKKTNQKFEGRIKVDNLINYINNRQLFENIVRVRRVL